MRTIKFRGYSKDFTENEWFFGNLIDKGNGSFQILEKNPKIWDLSYDGITVIPESIGQFTGLPDKNGKEIYEGDINQFGYVIKYCKEKALFGEYGTRNGIDYDILMSYPIDSKSQIIKGNIYENPELLEKKFAD